MKASWFLMKGQSLVREVIDNMVSSENKLLRCFKLEKNHIVGKAVMQWNSSTDQIKIDEAFESALLVPLESVEDDDDKNALKGSSAHSGRCA